MKAAPYPNAVILPHPAMSASQAEQVCKETGREIHMDGKGHLSLELPFEWHDFTPTEPEAA